MRAKHTRAVTAALLGLGLLVTGCGPIAFQDTVNFKLPEPEPEPEPEVSHAKVEGDHIVIDEKIQFEFDSAQIQRRSHSILNDVIKVMEANPQIEELDIIGHTSSEGSKKHNQELSRDRAQAVKQYLLDHGLTEDRLTSQGKGPSEPIADNDTEEGREANRRVEFKITKMGEAPADAAAAPAEGDAEAKGGARGRPGA